MPVSQNGWSASPNPSDFGGLDVRNVGAIRIGIRSGDVATVLFHFLEMYNKKVEKLKKDKCGCYNYRTIGNSKTISNHGSATAVDVNWSDHVQGKRGTFSKEQVEAIRDILEAFDGVIRWGGDYSNPDEMHFEIIGGESEVKRVAKHIKPRTVQMQTIQSVIPLLKEGDDDEDFEGYNLIYRIQRIVRTEKVDGVWGPKTTKAISDFTGIKEDDCKELNERIYRVVFGAWSGK